MSTQEAISYVLMGIGLMSAWATFAIILLRK